LEGALEGPKFEIESREGVLGRGKKPPPHQLGVLGAQ